MRKNRDDIPSKPLDRKIVLYLLAAFIISGYFVIKIGLEFSSSLFVQQPDRVNFVIYGEYPVFYSFGIKDVGNYAIPFYPDLKTQIPGGYGNYRIGAIGKLVELDKKPALFSKTFSSITSTFVQFYFYEGGEQVYYGGFKEQGSPKPQIMDILFMKSNASFWDRLYLTSFINKAQPSSLSSINALPYQKIKDDTLLRTDNFLKKYIGLFYNKTYRNDNLNIQILYSNQENYPTAAMISDMLNGSGIVVGDISRRTSSSKKCNIIEEAKTPSKTAYNLSSFFNCEIKRGDTDVYDILFVLGDLEESWEVN